MANTEGTTPPATGPTSVYAWLTGQDFNIGDSLLRRPYLGELSRIGPVHAWVRHASPGYLAGLGTEQAASLETSFVRWYAKLVASALHRRTVIALNAGESYVSPKGSLRLILLTMAGELAKLRGGGIVWLGASIVPSRRVMLARVYRWTTNRARLVRWRETAMNSFAPGHDIGPDWAFALGSPTTKWTPAKSRHRIAFILRGDRPRPSAAWMDWARSLASSLELTPVLVVQVTIDEEHAVELAGELSAEVLTWPRQMNHAQQEERVRELFQTCRLAVGDRLHGLIVAATEGAVPLGWVESSAGKIRKHFDAVGMTYTGENEGGSPGDGAWALTTEDVDALARDLAGRIDETRDMLRVMNDQMDSLFAEGAPAVS